VPFSVSTVVTALEVALPHVHTTSSPFTFPQNETVTDSNDTKTIFESSNNTETGTEFSYFLDFPETKAILEILVCLLEFDSEKKKKKKPEEELEGETKNDENKIVPESTPAMEICTAPESPVVLEKESHVVELPVTENVPTEIMEETEVEEVVQCNKPNRLDEKKLKKAQKKGKSAPL